MISSIFYRYFAGATYYFADPNVAKFLKALQWFHSDEQAYQFMIASRRGYFTHRVKSIYRMLGTHPPTDEHILEEYQDIIFSRNKETGEVPLVKQLIHRMKREEIITPEEYKQRAVIT